MESTQQTQQFQKNDPWTPEMRDDFIDFAIHTSDDKGTRGHYHFNTYPKLNGTEPEDFRKGLVTEALAKTIYNKNPAYRKLSLNFFQILTQKLYTNPNTAPFMGRDIIPLIKGGNAYAFLTGGMFAEDFQFSDLDIVVYINPSEPQKFAYLERSVRIVLMQTISQFKRTLDHMLFLNRPIDDAILDQQTINEFKADYNRALEDVVLPDRAMLISPFESDEIRNYCSRNSFMLFDSVGKDSRVVKVETPHFPRSERIPLRKSPIFCSVNQSINFVRDSDTPSASKGHFDLYRLRFNNRYVEMDVEGGIVKEERVAADFIDISIAAMDDSELINFWNYGRCVCIYDTPSNIWLTVPDIRSCISDLHNMLYKFDCPESKRQKRLQKYNLMKSIAAAEN